MKPVLLLPLAVIMVTACATQANNPAQDRYEEMFAESVFGNTIQDLACYSHRYHLSQEGKPVDLACGEYGVTIADSFALVRTAAGDKGLAQMFALGLDAGWSESRTCSALIRGKALLPALRALDFQQVREKCEQTLNDVIREYPKADPGKVCNSVEKIRSIVTRIVGQIELGQICEPWNYD